MSENTYGGLTSQHLQLSAGQPSCEHGVPRATCWTCMRRALLPQLERARRMRMPEPHVVVDPAVPGSDATITAAVRSDLGLSGHDPMSTTPRVIKASKPRHERARFDRVMRPNDPMVGWGPLK